MAFCMNCGQPLPDGAKFCTNCGISTGQKLKDNCSERKQEFVGKVKKCPACGEEIPALTAICPACGHEINSTKVTSSLSSFIQALDECDARIAQEAKGSTTQKGFRVWDKKIKIGWIVLNIMTSFIPLAIYLALPYIKPFFGYRTPNLNPEEKKKANIIENYAFPNEREAILEAILFIKNKIAFLASSKYNLKTAYWMSLWNAKANQLQEKAKLMLNNDSIAEVAYTEIIQYKHKVQKKVRIRAAVAAGIVVLFSVFVMLNGSLYRGISSFLNKTGIIENSVFFEWYDTGLCTKLPKVHANSGHYWTNTEEELDVYVDGYSSSAFEKYITACKEKGFTVKAEKDTDAYTAYNADGDYLHIYLIGNRMEIELKTISTGDESFIWPEHSMFETIPKVVFDSGRLGKNSEEEIEVFLYNFDKQDFDSYVQQCKEYGFSIDAEDSKGETWYRYEAYNTNGYKLRVSVDNLNELSICVRVPRSQEALSWPSSGPAILLPKLKNCTGEIGSDYDWTFSAYVTNMTVDDFNDYIEKCIKKGYVKDYRSDHYFSADKGENVSLTIEYIGYNTVYISVTDYDAL